MNTLEYLDDAPYPPPGCGRYVRWRQRADYMLQPQEPPERRGLIWAKEEKSQFYPVRDYCAGIDCGPDGARALIGWGAPPPDCHWLPPLWPAGLFPLGPNVAHLIGWRGMVRAAVSYEPDPDYYHVPKTRWAYFPDDVEREDWECGWRALVRATRLLARRHELISDDRLYAPYPASVHEARQEVEPLLDGLVLFASVPPPVAEADVAGTTAAASSADHDRPVWNPTSRVLSFRGAQCKRFKRTAPDQERVLTAFQEDGWPAAINDPLPPDKSAKGTSAKQKLATTVESLNDRLQHIKFTLNGAGEGILWEPH